MTEEQVVLVDADDNAVGLMAKIPAHEQGALHRAFSVFVIRRGDAGDELLLQRRALEKYHFGGLWTNTCCGHPRQGESPQEAGTRRLPEEMNFTCELESVGSFTYRARAANGLEEHEFDHVLLGFLNVDPPEPNPREAAEIRWIGFNELDSELVSQPETFTPWFCYGYEILRTALAAR